jgi:phenylacetate-coenzyme A ligase PaaK-like adenylate-forming protein
MTTGTETLVPVTDLSSEERWDIWVARGVEDDRKFKKRAIVTFAAVGAIAIGALGVWQVLGL